MSTLPRTDMSLLGQWWWTVDRWSLGALLALIMFGVLMIFAASPAVAVRLNLDSYHFVQRHFIIVPIGLLIIFLTSLLSPKNVRRIASIGFVAGLSLLILTLIFGAEIKGSQRWLSIGGGRYKHRSL